MAQDLVRRFEAGGRIWTVFLASGHEREHQACAQLERLLTSNTLTKWTYTADIRIQRLAVPQSHPVLTLNTKYLDRDDLALATFLHEQIHWFAAARSEAVQAAISDFRSLYPDVPVGFPEGARNEHSTYLHLIINYLEYAALQEVLGREAARHVMEFRCQNLYTVIYRTVLTDADRIRTVLTRHGLMI